jgi:glycosyltransferase involved in cell wall biosynthesis
LHTIYSIVADAGGALPTDAERERSRARLGLSRANNVLVYVAGVCRKKNQLAFLEHVVPQLLERFPNLVVLFVGDFRPNSDAYASQCATAAQALDATQRRVRFVGFAEHVREYYLAADVTCLASRYEGLARCMIESIAVGTPVVSFDVTSAREILVGQGGGVVCDLDDFGAMWSQISALLTDGERRRGLGVRGAAVAGELFRPETAVAAYERLFDQIATRSDRAGIGSTAMP